MSRACVAVSPHLDDAVFSAGGLLFGLRADGWDVTVVTVFTGSVAAPTGFALACQTDKGLAPDVDYLALRREEDVVACAWLGVDAVHLGLLEAPHRGYASAPELFAGVRDDDAATTVPAVAGSLSPFVRDADLVLSCEGIGGHVDHLVVRAALDALDVPFVAWRDQPYGLRHDAPPVGSDAVRLPVAGEALERKLDACAAYATQLGFQFGGEDAMRKRLTGVDEVLDAALG